MPDLERIVGGSFNQAGLFFKVDALDRPVDQVNKVSPIGDSVLFSTLLARPEYSEILQAAPTGSNAYAFVMYSPRSVCETLFTVQYYRIS